MKVVIAFLCLYLASSSDTDSELKFKRDTITNYIISHPNAKISDYGYMMEDLFDSHSLWEQNIMKRESFRRIMKGFDKNMRDGAINRLHRFAVEYSVYIRRMQLRENLFAAIKSASNLKVAQLVSLIQPFIHYFELTPEHGANYDAFLSQLISKDDQTTPEEANTIHPYLTFYYIYLNDITTRNDLLVKVDSKTDIPISSIESLIRSFSERYGLIERETPTNTLFNSLVKRKDFKIDQTDLTLLKNYVDKYKDHLKRVASRENFISFVEDTPDTEMAAIAVVMDPLLAEYALTASNKFTTEAELLNYAKGIDFTFTASHAKIIFPYYHDYENYKARRAASQSLIQEIERTPVNVADVENAVKTFSSLFHTIDADVFDLTSLTAHISKYDSTVISEETLVLIKNLLTDHNLKAFKSIIRKNVMDYLTANTDTKYVGLSPYMHQLIGAFNLFDEALGTDEAKIKERINEVLSAQETALFDSHYAKYTQFLTEDAQITRLEALEKLIQLRPKASYDMLSFFVTEFETAFSLTDIQKTNFDEFAKIESLKQVRSAEELRKTFSRIRALALFGERTAIIEEIKNKFDERSEENSNKLVKNLEKLVDIFKITPADVDKKETLESQLSRFEKPGVTVSEGQITVTPAHQVSLNDGAYELIKKYVLSSQYRWRQRKMLCEEESTHCGIEKPEGGSELWWYNFFKFFGGEPHEVPNTSFDDLNWFKRTFNKMYKYLTGFDYYITSFKPFGRLASENTTQTSQTTETTQAAEPVETPQSVETPQPVETPQSVETPQPVETPQSTP